MSGSTQAEPLAPPPSKTGGLHAVSDTLADLARQQAEKGRGYEQRGQYVEALLQYQEAIAGLDKYIDQPSNQANGNPKAFLVRAGAAADATRALSRSSGGSDVAGIHALATRADSDFTTVIRLSSPVDPDGRAMIQKATLGRGYVRLLAGNLGEARKDLQGLDVGPAGQLSAAQKQVQGAIVRLDHDISASVKGAPERGRDPKNEKLTALMNLGQEVVKAFFPKYQGLAVAVGNVADAFQK